MHISQNYLENQSKWFFLWIFEKISCYYFLLKLVVISYRWHQVLSMKIILFYSCLKGGRCLTATTLHRTPPIKAWYPWWSLPPVCQESMNDRNSSSSFRATDIRPKKMKKGTWKIATKTYLIIKLIDKWFKRERERDRVGYTNYDCKVYFLYHYNVL